MDVNRPKVLKTTQMSRCIGCYSCMLACARLVHKSYSPRHSAVQIKSSGGLQGKLVADICRGCAEPACAAACIVEAIVPRKGGGVRFRKDKCTGCQACIAACVVNSIKFNEQEQKPVICIQCGTCASYCPHDVLVMEAKD